MKKTILCVVMIVLTISISQGQKSSFSIKAGLSNVTTRIIQDPPDQYVRLGPSGDRAGIQAGVAYDYKLLKYVRLGVDFQYLMKGYSNQFIEQPPYAEHYLGLSPTLSFFPFANSQTKYVSCISPGVGFNLNYLIAAKFKWQSHVDRYYWETGYTLKLNYQPGKFGLQIYYSIPFTKYLVYHNHTPPFDESRYYFVTGISFVYKFF